MWLEIDLPISPFWTIFLKLVVIHLTKIHLILDRLIFRKRGGFSHIAHTVESQQADHIENFFV